MNQSDREFGQPHHGHSRPQCDTAGCPQIATRQGNGHLYCETHWEAPADAPPATAAPKIAGEWPLCPRCKTLPAQFNHHCELRWNVELGGDPQRCNCCANCCILCHNGNGPEE